MTKEVVTIYEEENLENLLRGMEQLGFHHLPVVDENRLVGLITRTDLLAASVSRLMPGALEAEHALEENVFVAQIMQRDVPTAPPDMPLAEAARLMREKKLTCLPVVSLDDELVGIVTASDFVRLAELLLG
jgi:CBS domain-containing protein